MFCHGALENANKWCSDYSPWDLLESGMNFQQILDIPVSSADPWNSSELGVWMSTQNIHRRAVIFASSGGGCSLYVWGTKSAILPNWIQQESYLISYFCGLVSPIFVDRARKPRNEYRGILICLVAHEGKVYDDLPYSHMASYKWICPFLQHIVWLTPKCTPTSPNETASPVVIHSYFIQNINGTTENVCLSQLAGGGSATSIRNAPNGGHQLGNAHTLTCMRSELGASTWM